MRSVAMLCWQSFTGTRLSSVLAASGLVLFAASIAIQLEFPSWTLGVGMNRGLSLGAQLMLQALPWFAVLALFLSTAAQPRVIRGLVFGHAVASLPHVRLTALLGAVAVAAAVALAAATSATLFYIDYPIPIDLGAVFGRAWAIAFVNFGLLYLAFWALANVRGYWYFVGPVLILVAISVPAALLNAPNETFGWRLLLGVGGWLAYAVLILAGDGLALRASDWLRSRGRSSAGAADARPMRTIPVLLGADRAWVGMLVPVVAVALVVLIVPEEGVTAVVLSSLILMAALQGARSVFAAPRSRTFWLRMDVSRDVLFGFAERAFWQQDLAALATAAVVFAGLGLVLNYPLEVVVSGVALLVLATATGLYLGLSMTRGLPFVDAALAAGIMTLVVLAALFAGRDTGYTPRLLGLGAALVVAVPALRLLARRRWQRLDWMRCRAGSQR